MLGLLIGFALGLHRFSAEVGEPMLVSFYSVPKITLYPIVLLAFGIGMPAKIAFGAIHGVVPMAIFTMTAIRTLNPVLLKTAKVMRLAPWARGADDHRAQRAAGNLHRHPRQLLADTDRHVARRDVRFTAWPRLSAHDGNRSAEVKMIMAVTLLLVLFAASVSVVLIAIDRRLHRATG